MPKLSELTRFERASCAKRRVSRQVHSSKRQMGTLQRRRTRDDVCPPLSRGVIQSRKPKWVLGRSEWPSCWRLAQRTGRIARKRRRVMHWMNRNTRGVRVQRSDLLRLESLAATRPLTDRAFRLDDTPPWAPEGGVHAKSEQTV